MITDDDQLAFGSLMFKILCHGRIRPDGTEVQPPGERELAAETLFHSEQAPLSLGAWPKAMSEFTRLANEAGIDTETALK